MTDFFEALLTNPLPVTLVIVGVILIALAIISPRHIQGARAYLLGGFGALLLVAAALAANFLIPAPEIAMPSQGEERIPTATPPAPGVQVTPLITAPVASATSAVATTSTATPPPEATAVIPADAVPITIALPDGAERTIQVQPVLGEINQLAAAAALTLPVFASEEWEWTIAEPWPVLWRAYELPDGGSAPCPDWPNRYNSVSLRHTLSAPVLIFAEKGGDYPARLLLPLGGSGEIPYLDNLFRGDLPNGAGPLNASIQVFLVPTGVEGSVTVYDGNIFTGNTCTLSFTP